MTAFETEETSQQQHDSFFISTLGNLKSEKLAVVFSSICQIRRYLETSLFSLFEGYSSSLKTITTFLSY